METNLPKDPETVLTENFSWQEARVTNHRDYDNYIPDLIVSAIKSTARRMERVRALLGNVPISVSSWYRCPDLNKAIGGSTRSQHMLGEAVDFICPRFGSPLEICRHLTYFKDLLGFDQLILEHTWVHISFPSIPNAVPKGQVLTLLQNKRSYAHGLTDLKGNLV